MSINNVGPVMFWILMALAISWLMTRAAIAYAQRHGLLDLPGQRRSHRSPTPRGGGIGIVLAMLVVLAGSDEVGAIWPRAALGLALILVAAIGWWDDHRSLTPWSRLCVHALAAGLVAVSCIYAHAFCWWWLAPLLLAGIWSINLHNFMDGIDGLLAQQGAWVAGVLAWLAWRDNPQPALLAACVAAATVGFAWFNRPPARIFMGDVGSGSMGLLLFALTAWLGAGDLRLGCAALILSSAFATDSSLTLLARMSRGRAWWRPHCEHLYQWLTRAGMKHGRVSLIYLIWNMLMLIPAWSAANGSLQWALILSFVVYAMATAVWWAGKSRMPRQVRRQGVKMARRFPS